jgi:hypothetical protein
MRILKEDENLLRRLAKWSKLNRFYFSTKC